ncbi:MAG: heme-binding protein [Planctomycetota bacterium]
MARMIQTLRPAALLTSLVCAAASADTALLAQEGPAPAATADARAPLPRLLQPADLPARTKAAKRLEALIGGDNDLWTTVALAATSGTSLPMGSMARTKLDTALDQALKGAAGKGDSQAAAKRALDRLRLDVGDLVEALSFRVFEEADYPEGFPRPTTIGEIELRDYPTYRMARTKMNASGSNGAFWPLFQHIKKNEISMTAPVQMDYSSEKQGSDDAAGTQRPATMAFLYGSKSIDPSKVDAGIEVVDVPKVTVLSIGGNGFERKARLVEMEQQLRAFAAASPDLEVAGPIRTMSYNGPSVRGERRYYEVQLPVRKAAVVR